MSSKKVAKLKVQLPCPLQNHLNDSVMTWRRHRLCCHFPGVGWLSRPFPCGSWWGITLLTFNIILVQVLYGAYQLPCEAGTLSFTSSQPVLYISAGLSHSDRMSVGVEGSVDMGLTASQPLLHWVDRLLLQQHQWWKMDDAVLLLLKPTLVTVKSDGHVTLCFNRKHLLTVLWGA